MTRRVEPPMWHSKVTCELCGAVTGCLPMRAGWICLRCADTAVAITMDKLAGSMVAEEERNAIP